MPLLLVVASGGLLSGVAAIALIVENRGHTIESANRDNSNIARLVGFHVSHVLRSSSRLLDDVTEMVLGRGVSFFRSEDGRQLLRDRTRDFPELQAVALADGQGELVVATSLPFPPPSINYSDRDYFRRHQAGEDLVLGELIMSRSLGRRGTTVSRAIRSRDGALVGVVIITIESDHFMQLFERIERSANEAISVLRMDGAIFVRMPEVELGRRFPNAEVFSHLSSARRGTYEAIGPIDGVPRFVAFERIDGFPLVVVTSQGRQVVLAPWWTFTGAVAGGLVIALGLLSAASVHAFRSAARTEALRSELERQAQTDSLTGLANRRHFMVLAEKELSRTVRYGGSMAVLMVDIDHFKNVNDTYGHLRGDDVLRRLTEVCQLNLRNIDTVGRLGGDEFAVFLPQTNGDRAREVAERLRRTVEESTVGTAEGQPIRITVSIGLATLWGTATDIEPLLAQADQALYEAKHAGRNRVVASPQRAALAPSVA